jgi:hypothetical protein
MVLLLVPFAGCGGNDDEAKKKAPALDGTFVGKVSGTKAFVAVVASPTQKGKDRRDLTLYICDGRRLCEWFTGSATEDGFAATSNDRDAKAKGKLSDKAVTGTIELPGGRTVRYTASPATATAGLYNLTVSSKGRLRGTSAAGVGLKGEVTLPGPGTGSLKLADGRRLEFDVTTNSAGDPVGLRAGRVRLIVLAGRQLRGAGKNRRTASGGETDFFIRSKR